MHIICGWITGSEWGGVMFTSLLSLYHDYVYCLVYFPRISYLLLNIYWRIAFILYRSFKGSSDMGPMSCGSILPMMKRCSTLKPTTKRINTTPDDYLRYNDGDNPKLLFLFNVKNHSNTRRDMRRMEVRIKLEDIWRNGDGLTNAVARVRKGHNEEGQVIVPLSILVSSITPNIDV